VQKDPDASEDVGALRAKRRVYMYEERREGGVSGIGNLIVELRDERMDGINGVRGWRRYAGVGHSP
jgi:hypothetical protein